LAQNAEGSVTFVSIEDNVTSRSGKTDRSTATNLWTKRKIDHRRRASRSLWYLVHDLARLSVYRRWNVRREICPEIRFL